MVLGLSVQPIKNFLKPPSSIAVVNNMPGTTRQAILRARLRQFSAALKLYDECWTLHQAIQI
jgi:hypothetical protein